MPVVTDDSDRCDGFATAASRCFETGEIASPEDMIFQNPPHAPAVDLSVNSGVSVLAAGDGPGRIDLYHADANDAVAWCRHRKRPSISK